MMALATTARAVESYRDTSLDGLIGQENGMTRGSSHRRNNASHNRHSVSDGSNMSSVLPEAPEVPRAPPLSYRTNAPENDTPQRSFSQRAKARPFLRDALADEEAFDNRPPSHPRRQPTDINAGEDGGTSRAGGARRGVEGPLHVNTAIPVRKAARFPPASATTPLETTSAVRSPRVNDQRSRRVSQNSQYPEEPMSAVTRSSAMRDIPNLPTDGQRRDWAPDRSPLQKLEVTLNDISKEEKRARVEEAEMLLREAKTGRGGRPTSRDITPMAQAPMRQPSSRIKAGSTEATNLEDAGLVRSLSGTQRDRLQHSTTVDSRKPDVRRLSGDGRRGFEYGEQQYGGAGQVSARNSGAASNRRTSRDYVEGNQPDSPARERMHSVRHQAAIESLPAAAEQYERTHPSSRTASGRSADLPRQVENSPAQPQAPDTSSRFPQHNPVWQTNTQIPAHSVPSNITRAVSMQHGKPPARFTEDREILRSDSIRKDANASHKATFAEAGMIGAGAAAAESVTTRNGSRKLQKASPSGYDRTRDRPENQPYSLDSVPNRGSAQRAQEGLERGGTSLYSESARQTFQPASAPAANVQRNRSQKNTPIGLGLRESPQAAATNNNPLPDSHSQRPRQQSVSFKEPFDKPRPVDEWKEGGVARLGIADFTLDRPTEADKDQAWWESQNSAVNRRKSRRKSTTRSAAAGSGDAAIDDRHAEFKPPLYLKCGPLLRYTGMKRTRGENSESGPSVDHEICRYSVMIVTQDSHSSYETAPTLRLFSRPKRLLPPPPQHIGDEELAPEYVDPIAGSIKLSRTGKALYVRPVDHLDEEKDLSRIEDDNGLFEEAPSPLDINGSREATAATTNKRTEDVDGERVGKFQELKGVRLYADPIRDVTFWRFNIEIELGDTQQHIAYRINQGAALGFWAPARGKSMNIMFHSCNGFSFSVDPNVFSGPDPLWRDVLNTAESSPFHVMIGGGDQVYMDRVMADTMHFGEWTRLRNPHHKHNAAFSPEMREELETFYLERYSMWFSQGLFGMANSQIPMVNMWDDHDLIDGFGSYPDHLMRSEVFSGLGGVAFKYYMLFQHHSVPEETTADEPSWVLGHKPGPYIPQVSRSIFVNLGKHIAFLGLDCRTERTRTEIMSLDTYDTVLERCRRDIVEGETKHLILLLGVPIAYPRLVFLENLLTSRAMDPIKALGRVGVLKGGFLNKFDGGVEILDDLDDHWTAKNHKEERNDFIEDLQDLAAEKSVRITILGGDVHLGAIGQFYSNPKLRIPKDRDHRYMPNIISSAIVNTPPSNTVADILNKRNRVHHLNKYTDESMIPMFSHDVDGKRRNNKNLLPRRNWCSIKEYEPGLTPPPTPPESLSASSSEVGEDEHPEPPKRRFSFSKEDVNPRNLFRRISSRGAPPSSYRNNNVSNEPEDVDPNCPVHGGGGHHSQSALPKQQRQSFDSAQPSQRAASFEHTSSGAPVRPGMFLRRPTNLSEKAARKGNMPGIDKEGNEIEVNDYVNLEGGLDILLNMEVNQKDPAGITAPYRLLVPALWYDGSSDREKLDDAAEVQRKPTLLKRFSGVGGRKFANAKAQNGDETRGQEDGNETGSYSESEDGEKQPSGGGPKRLFGLFGSRKGRKEERYEDEYEEDHDHEQPGAPQSSQRGDRLFDSENRPPSDHLDLHNAGRTRHTNEVNPQQQSPTNTRQSYVIASQPPPPQQQPPSAMRRDFSGSSDNSLDSPQLRQQQAIPPPQRQLSKQERILGIQAQPVPPRQQAEPRPLRGDGIIGRDRGFDGSDEMSPALSQGQYQGPGYNSIEAYRPPKPERRWSLRGVRDRARSGTKWDWVD